MMFSAAEPIGNDSLFYPKFKPEDFGFKKEEIIWLPRGHSKSFFFNREVRNAFLKKHLGENDKLKMVADLVKSCGEHTRFGIGQKVYFHAPLPGFGWVEEINIKKDHITYKVRTSDGRHHIKVESSLRECYDR